MDKSTYIISAINDTQSTIRAIDTKTTALLAALLIPFSSIGKIYSYFLAIPNCFLTLFLSSLFVIFWLLALTTSIRTLASIDSPSAHISECDNINGSFYSAGIFDLREADAFINLKQTVSSLSFADFINKYPSKIEDIIKELAFEHMKLIYIRDIKNHRLHSSIQISILWFITGLFTFLIVKTSHG